ncbi:MAG: thioredoxin [Candidatus Omnitrophota bacterium]
MAMSVTHFTDANFKEEVLDSATPVLVDFWATWCGPCRMIAPVVEEISNEYAGTLKVGKVDVDANSKVASQFGIMSIPTIMIFKNGKVMEQVVGALSKGQLKSMIDSYIK